MEKQKTNRNPLDRLKPFNSTQGQTLRQTCTPDLLLGKQRRSIKHEQTLEEGKAKKKGRMKEGRKEGMGRGGGWKGLGEGGGQGGWAIRHPSPAGTDD